MTDRFNAKTAELETYWTEDQQSIDLIDKGIRHSDYPDGTAQDVTAERRATLVAHRDMLRNRILMERRYIETGR
jgi:hypothetical protein